MSGKTVGLLPQFQISTSKVMTVRGLLHFSEQLTCLLLNISQPELGKKNYVNNAKNTYIPFLFNIALIRNIMHF